MFTGSLIAIVTPFKNGKLDERALGDLIEWQISSGTHGIVPCGTTGESATLTHAEHDRVVAFTVEVARRRVPVIAGTGSNSTEEAIALTKHAKTAGADGARRVTHRASVKSKPSTLSVRSTSSYRRVFPPTHW